MIRMALCIKLAVELLYNILEGTNCYRVWIFFFFIMGCTCWSIRPGKPCLSYSLIASDQILQILTPIPTPRECKALFNVSLALLRHVEVELHTFQIS
jgi:hypothetical protein